MRCAAARERRGRSLYLLVRDACLCAAGLDASRYTTRASRKIRFLHGGGGIRGQVVAESVALVDRTPELAGLGIDRDSSARIADSVGVDLQLTIGGIASEDVGAIFFAGMRVGVVNVRRGADGHEHAFAVRGEFDGASPVAAAEGQVGDVLRGAAGLQITVVIGEADEFVGVADVNPLWIGTGRIEGDSVRLAEAFGENLHLFGLAIFGHAAKNADAA